MKRIKLLATGGTIAGVGKNSIDLKDYIPGKLKADELLEEVPEILKIANVETEQLSNFGSSSITPAHWILLKNKVETSLNEEEYDGIVITHGTNTLEETAYFLHLTVNSHKPVVLVGAQRPITAMSSDAKINLYNAMKVATNSSSHGRGVLVVLNDSIHDARNVTKTNTYHLEAFNSRGLGCIGFIESDNTVHYYQQTSRRHTTNSQFSKMDIKKLPKVTIFYSFAGSDSDLIDYAVKSGRYQGFILAGTGGGHGSSAEIEGLLKGYDEGILIVRSSRVGEGKIVKIDKEKWKNTITADNLLPQKARILLMLSLLVTKDKETIQSFFNEY